MYHFFDAPCILELSHNRINLGSRGIFEKIAKNAPKMVGKNPLFFLFIFLGGGSKKPFLAFLIPPQKLPFRAIGEKKVKKKTKSEKLAIFGRFTPSGYFFLAILAILGYFLKKKLCSRGLHYYGMILLCIWVRFKHFPPLVDFSSLKTPPRHMWWA